MDKMTLKQSNAIPIDWPLKPKSNGLCLSCDSVKRNRFSWFCGDECERVYIDSEILT